MLWRADGSESVLSEEAKQTDTLALLLAVGMTEFTVRHQSFPYLT